MASCLHLLHDLGSDVTFSLRPSMTTSVYLDLPRSRHEKEVRCGRILLGETPLRHILVGILERLRESSDCDTSLIPREEEVEGSWGA